MNSLSSIYVVMQEFTFLNKVIYIYIYIFLQAKNLVAQG